jgi:hypothetical protein
MAGDYNSAEANIELPSQFGSIGNALQNYTATKERRQQREDALSERRFEFDQRNQLAQQEKADRNRLFNLKQIQDATAQKQFETPNHIIDNQIGTELKSIHDDSFQFLDKDPAFVDQYIKNRIGKVSQWSDLAKQHAQQIKDGITEFNKTVPNTDLNKTYEYTNQQFKDNFFDKDQMGNYSGLKDPHLIAQNVNYLEQFNDPNKLATIVNNTEPLYKFFKEIPKEAIHGSEYVNKKGNVVSNKWSGWGTPYTQVVGDENDKPTAQVPYQAAMVTEQGEPIKIATPQLRQAMIGNPAVEASFIKEWGNEVARKGLQNVDSHALDILKENFRHRFAEQQLLPTHQVNLDEKVVTPTTKNYISTGSKETSFNDIAQQLEDFLPKEGLAPLTSAPSEVREYLSNSVNKSRGIDNHLDIDKLSVVKANNGSYRVLDMNNDGEVVGVFSRKGINLSGAKGKNEREAAKKDNQQAAPQTKMTPTQWNDSWTKLKVGQTMVGLDGKTYTKK